MRFTNYFILNCLFYHAVIIVVQARVISYSSYTRNSLSRFNSIFAFGDSYTANGSLKEFFEKNETTFDEQELHPDTIKTIKRSTNGIMWVEYLSKLINNASLYDFAQSGATANNDLVAHPSSIDMTHQISRYLASDVAMRPKDASLYVLWTGVNDIRLLFEGEDNDSARKTMSNNIAASISNDMQRLYSQGAKYIILVGLIPLDLIPMYSDKPPKTKKALNELVNYYNSVLISTVNSLKAGKDYVNTLYFDTYRFFETTFSQQELQRNAKIDCGGHMNCGDMIWWNNLHLTTATHKKIANAVYDSIVLLDW